MEQRRKHAIICKVIWRHNFLTKLFVRIWSIWRHVSLWYPQVHVPMYRSEERLTTRVTLMSVRWCFLWVTGHGHSSERKFSYHVLHSRELADAGHVTYLLTSDVIQWNLLVTESSRLKLFFYLRCLDAFVVLHIKIYSTVLTACSRVGPWTLCDLNEKSHRFTFI